MATLKDLLADCYRGLNYGPTPPVDVTTRLTGFLNETQAEVLSLPSCRRLVISETTITLEAGQERYGLQPAIQRVRAIIDTRNQHRLRETALDTHLTAVPDPASATGTPETYSVIGYRPVRTQPKYFGTIGLRFQGNSPTVWPVTVSTTIVTSGDSLVSNTNDVTLVSTALSWVGAPPPNLHYTKEVLALSLSAPAPEIIEVWYPASPMPPDATEWPPPGMTYYIGSWIDPGHTSEEHLWVALTPTPAETGATLRIIGETHVQPLLMPSDRSPLPAQFHGLLTAGARMKEYELRGDRPRFELARAEFNTSIGFLVNHLHNDADDVPVPHDRRGRGPNPLGGWYPYSPYRRW